MFSQKKNKKFSYQSRFSKEGESATKLKESLNTSWDETRRTSSSSKKGNTLFLLLGVLIFIGVLMYYLESKTK
ncbi:hypothetical protein [Olleya sp. 1-3]|uniref:hypothetical protein n=1 Tax=Olleya sp. 1-3 TaxID=2058323 RepID=UPI000C342B6F|nr:hypothetical protein [Olleya sp. 1-3]PKG51460.1 hypothetical protein CXF54_08625 [Olleya sp. 1-3]